MSPTTAAILFALLAVMAILFQIALAAGAPWGHLTMGGRFAGRLPPSMRVAAVVQGAVLATLGVLVLARAGLAVAFPSWTIWIAVGISGISLVMNLATPSKGERMLWAPVGAAMLATSLVVALAG